MLYAIVFSRFVKNINQPLILYDKLFVWIYLAIKKNINKKLQIEKYVGWLY